MDINALALASIGDEIAQLGPAFKELTALCAKNALEKIARIARYRRLGRAVMDPTNVSEAIDVLIGALVAEINCASSQGQPMGWQPQTKS